MTATGRLHRSSPVLLLLAALAGGCAGGDVVGTVPPTGGGPPTGEPSTPPNPGPPVSTSDDVLGLDPDSLWSVDLALEAVHADTPSLTLDEVRSLEEAVLAETGHDVVLSVGRSAMGPDIDWTAYSTDDTDLAASTLAVADPGTVLGVESSALAVEYGDDDIDVMTVEVITGWELGLSEAVELALQVRPGDVVLAELPDEPASIVLVGIRAEDGSVHRVGIDAVTGDVLNVVEPDPVTPGPGTPEPETTDCAETGAVPCGPEPGQDA
ncbi:MAG: PepSY domain-containing protein [Actinomycetaceae bacterium]